MLFISIKGIHRLISKGVSHIYIKVTIEKRRRSQNFDVLNLIFFSSGQFLGSSNSHRYHKILKFLVAN